MRGIGPVNVDLMFIGEAPGEEEETQNTPFVGPAGEIFNRMLTGAGISRDKVFLTNVARCRPKDESKWRRDRNGLVHYGNHAPSPLQSYTCGTKWLESEIRRVQPKAIVAMGNVAADYLFGKYRLQSDGTMQLNKHGDAPAVVRRMPTIGDLCYTNHWDSERNVHIVPMFHPSYIMRTPEIFVMMTELMKKAQRIAQNGPGKDVTEAFIATNFDDAMSVIRRACEFKTLAYDHETDGLDWRLGEMLNIGFSWKTGTGVSIRLVGNDGSQLYTPDQRRQLKDAMRPIFQNPDKELVGYHEAFDAAWTEAKLGMRVTTPRHDVQIIYHALNSSATTSRQSLEKLSWLYTDMADYKSESGPWFSKKDFVGCPVDVMSRRNAADCDATLRLFERFMPKLRSTAVSAHYDRMLRHLSGAAARLNLNGANIGLGRLRDFRDKLEDASEHLANQFCSGAGVPRFNLRSTKMLSATLFEHLGLPILARTPKGSPATSEYVLEELSKQAPALQPLMEYKKLQKLLGTYVLGLRGAALFGNSAKKKLDIWTVEEAWQHGYNTDGRVHPSYSMVGTVTGRPSVSKPNTANQPRPTPQQRRLGVVLRQAFQAPDGWSILECDQSQCELRVLAALSGDKVLADAVNSKEGVHRRTAAFLYKIPLDQVLDEHKSQAKTIVFAIVYGGTEHTVEEQIAEQLDQELRRRFYQNAIASGKSAADASAELAKYSPEKDERLALAAEWIASWRAQYPAAGRWIDQTKEFVLRNGYVVSVFGRVFHFPLVFSDNYGLRQAALRAAVNYLIQGPASDINMMAGLRVQAEIERRGYQTKWVNFVYDSLSYEVPDNELAEMKTLVVQEMERPVPGLDINFMAEMEVGRCWKEEKEEASIIEKLTDFERTEDEEEDEDVEAETAAV